MNPYLRHIEACARFDAAKFTSFFVDGKPVGFVRRDYVEPLTGALPDFRQTPEGFLALNPALPDFAARSAALAQGCALLSARIGMALRGEMYAVIEKWGDEALAEIDRAGVAWFGVQGFGVHVSGYVQTPSGPLLWIAERARDRPIDPGKLDCMIGGGMPIGISIEDNVVKEAFEEAGLDEPTARQAKRVGALSYKTERLGGVLWSTLFLFDLKLPPDHMPCNTDGEVASFTLMSAQEIIPLIRDTDRFKFNCAVVVLDFLARHGKLGDGEETTGFLSALAPLLQKELK